MAVYHLTSNGHVTEPSYVHKNLYGVIILGANILYINFKKIPMASKGTLCIYTHLPPPPPPPPHQATSGNVVEFMGAVMGVHSHYHQLISDLFSSHKLFFSALDRVSHRVIENFRKSLHERSHEFSKTFENY